MDLIQTREELGQLAILGGFLARDVLITAPERDEDDQERSGTQVTFHSRHRAFLETEIAALIAICGVVRDKSVDEVVAEVRWQLESWGYPMDSKPSDARPLGAGVEE